MTKQSADAPNPRYRRLSRTVISVNRLAPQSISNGMSALRLLSFSLLPVLALFCLCCHAGYQQDQHHFIKSACFLEKLFIPVSNTPILLSILTKKSRKTLLKFLPFYQNYLFTLMISTLPGMPPSSPHCDGPSHIAALKWRFFFPLGDKRIMDENLKKNWQTNVSCSANSE